MHHFGIFPDWEIPRRKSRPQNIVHQFVSHMTTDTKINILNKLGIIRSTSQNPKLKFTRNNPQYKATLLNDDSPNHQILKNSARVDKH